ncbi:MAG: L-2-amino-thiazoline-4-carboxylic acid hydrolase [Lachnospiraceae bacterium]
MLKEGYGRSSDTVCKIEHHAVLFALLAKHAVTLCGKKGEEAIQKGMTIYGRERGARMAANALERGDELTTMTNQAYGEWKPDYEGQMEFGQLRTEPTLQTYIAKCAWCDAWKKHDLLEYGKLYCVNVDHAVYQGFRSDFVCTPIATALSWGGARCEFDWGHPISAEEAQELVRKKKELGTSCMKDFNFHTAHLKHTISKTLTEELGEEGKRAAKLALDDYVRLFGQEYLEVLEGIYPSED